MPGKQQTQKSLAQHQRVAADRYRAISASCVCGVSTLKALGEHFDLHYATVG
ncbi:MAG: hypothetical protein ABI386_07545 [Rhodanobacter sp.]